ncbi:MAG: 16S rRNA processing protein RimM [Clostridia bacterium]|nr:16S rRNA processing protein RimM [Clostridia bacterium]
MKRFLEAGVLGAPRGVRGELRFDCWCDSPDFLRNVKRFYFDAEGTKSLAVVRYHSSIPSVVFEGREDRQSAALLTGRRIWFAREDVCLPEGVYFNDDLIGLTVYDAESGEVIGTLAAIEEGCRNFLYRIKGDKEYLVPAVDAFVKSIDLEKGIAVSLIDGLEVG